MSAPRIGALFAGYGGLDLAVQSVLGGSLAWVSEFDKGANKILAHRFPDVPNHGDITKIDWSQVEPVDILTGGSPCQDLSHAGKRSGMTEGTRSNLWVAMREAIAQLRPGLVVWENVRGAYSAEATSALEFCAGCMGDAWYRGAALRALGRVLGDLSDLGYVGGWHGLRAADVGAPHGRFRVFVVAYPASNAGRIEHGDGATTPHPHFPVREALRGRQGSGDAQRRQPLGGRDALATADAVSLLPTPTTQDGANTGGPSRFDRNSLPLNALVTLLPTPAVNDMGEGKTVEAWDEWTAKMQAAHGNGNGHGKSLAIEAQRLLGTPAARDYKGSGEGARLEESARRGQVEAQVITQWGQYDDAIARWESLTRPAPAPTQPSKKGTPQLSAAFSEWLMGLPTGWVTNVPGITRSEALKALGNGVVPQQAEAALRFLLSAASVKAVA